MWAHDQLVTRVTLTLSCKGLVTADYGSLSDPLIQVMMKVENDWIEIGRTEHIKNTSNPEFVETLVVDYRFEEVQKMKFNVFDVDNDVETLGDDDHLGYLECNLAHIVSSKSFTKELVWQGRCNIGTITICAEEVAVSNSEITLQFQGKDLDKKDMFGKSDPFLEISKDLTGEDENLVPVYRTKHINNTLNPTWDLFSISTNKLCGSDYYMRLRIRCFDYDDDGSHDFIGECYTTVHDMTKENPENIQWELINPKKAMKKKGYKNSGVILLKSSKVVPIFSFLDYVMSGCQINFTVGIDFTGSNGEPSNPSSLHYIDPNEPNEYVKSLIAVGEICQDYDTDKMFPALGFGAKIPPSNELSFEFALNFNPTNPYCAGIFGVVAAYQSCVRQVQFWGPTNIAPIIHHIAKFTQSMIANREHIASNYFILLLLTDGAITDMGDTVDAIVAASFLPISLIIVGVGDADFSAMDFLDCDQGKLKSSKGTEAFRDIVQFVPFRQYKRASAAKLVSAVLAEIPKQVSEYFKLKNVSPIQ